MPGAANQVRVTVQGRTYEDVEEVRASLTKDDANGKKNRAYRGAAPSESGKHTKYMFWQNYYHPVELSTNSLSTQRLEHIHNNPVVAGIVDKAEEYLYSSARDYFGTGKGLLDILVI